METGDNKAVVRRFWQEVFNEGKLEVADELFAPNHEVDHPALPDKGQGSDVIKAIVVLARMVSPDIQVIVEDEVAEGEKVVTRWTASGSLAPDMRDPDRPDDEVRVSGINFFDFSNGTIRRTSLRFQSHDDYPQPVPKTAAVRERLNQELLLDPLWAARFRWRCFFKPWTCRWEPPDLPE
jgi:hypothetical protein